MILSDRCILRAIRTGVIAIEPIESFDPELQIGPGSVDLRLGGHFVSLDAGREFNIDVSGEFALYPGEFVLATTLETVYLDRNHLGYVDGRSSVARCGLIIEAAGLIDPGYRGQITLELYNQRRVPLVLKVGMRICQMSIHKLQAGAGLDYGERKGSKYQDQRGATPSRLEWGIREVNGWVGEELR